MSIDHVRPNIPKVPDVKDPGMPRDPEKLDETKPDVTPKLGIKTILYVFIPQIIKRIKLPDTTLGKIIQTIAGILGLGGGAAIATDTVIISGDIITDVIALIIATLSVYVIGKLPVPKDREHDPEYIG